MTKPVKLVEFGVSGGGSSGLLLNAISDRPNAKLISVDLKTEWYKDTTKPVGWAVYEHYKHDLGQWRLLTGRYPIEIIENEIGNGIDFCFIDTAHLHPDEILNFLVVLPFLKDGAPVVLHDISCFMIKTPKGTRAWSCLGATYLFNHIVGDKITPVPKEDVFVGLSNLGAFRITSDTRKYIGNLFSSLAMQWLISIPPKCIELYESFFDKYYGVECADMFRRASRAQEFMKNMDSKTILPATQTVPSAPQPTPSLKPNGILVTPEFEYVNFLDWCLKYNSNNDSLRLHPPATPGAPLPAVIASYHGLLCDEVSFTIAKLPPQAKNPMRVAWELSSDKGIICNGNEDASIPHTVNISVPPDVFDVKLALRLEYDPGISVAFCDVVITGWSYCESPIINRIRFMDGENTDLPVPPKELMGLYKSDSSYVLSGKNDSLRMISLLEKHGVCLDKDKKVLDFGCSTCRVLRYLPTLDSAWGVDFREKEIQWAMRQFPKLKLASCGMAPALPFADGYFDLAYAIDRFTEITDARTAWIAELARVTKSGGYAYFTFYDEESAHCILDGFNGKSDIYFKEFDWLMTNHRVRSMLKMFKFNSLNTKDVGNNKSYVFLSKKYITDVVSEFFEFVDMIPQTTYYLQSAYLLRRK